MAENVDCEAMRAEISRLQKEFETMWLDVSAGRSVPPTYRTVRHQLDELRAQYGRECGSSGKEESSLPPSILQDWRA
jgi:hypothetical protein